MAKGSPTTPTPLATSGSGIDLLFERELFASADKLRSNMDAAEYKHVVLGLLFLKRLFQNCIRIDFSRVQTSMQAARSWNA